MEKIALVGARFAPQVVQAIRPVAEVAKRTLPRAAESAFLGASARNGAIEGIKSLALV